MKTANERIPKNRSQRCEMRDERHPCLRMSRRCWNDKHRITNKTTHTTSTKPQHPQPCSQVHQLLVCKTLLIVTRTFPTCRQEFPSNWPMVKNTFSSSSSSWLSTDDFVYTSLFGHKNSSRKEPSDFGERHQCLHTYPCPRALPVNKFPCDSVASSSQHFGLLCSSDQHNSFVCDDSSMKSFSKFSAFVALLCHLPDLSAQSARSPLFSIPMRPCHPRGPSTYRLLVASSCPAHLPTVFSRSLRRRLQSAWHHFFISFFFNFLMFRVSLCSRFSHFLLVIYC